MIDKVSLLITTFNRAHLLQHNFERLSQLTKPDEIIVVDDGSKDNTREVCQKYEEIIDREIKYIYNNSPQSSICSQARNIGFKHASHDWIVTCEPELVYLTDAIKLMKEAHEDYPNDIISSGIVYFMPQGYVPGQDVTNYEKAGDYTPPIGTEEAIGWVAPYTALWNKEWVLELGGWDESFPGNWGWDDIDLLTRLRINGHGQYINLNIKAIHLFHGLGGDTNFQNEAHFRAKSFNNTATGDETQMTEAELIDLVANRDREWGQIRE